MAKIQDKAVQIMATNPLYAAAALGDAALRRAVITYEREIGLTPNQIAIKYNLNLNTVKSIVKRCKLHPTNK